MSHACPLTRESTCYDSLMCSRGKAQSWDDSDHQKVAGDLKHPCPFEAHFSETGHLYHALPCLCLH